MMAPAAGHARIRELEGRYKILVCRGPECGDKRFSRDVHAELVRVLRARGLEERIVLDWQSCFGRCRVGPNVMVRRVLPGEDPFLEAIVPRLGCEAVLYNGVRPADASRIVREHVEAGRMIQDLVRKAE
jgi:(2Fe-2S) ferredoxin